MPTARDIAKFRRIVLAHYATEGRDLPWRRTRNPYRILVSEVMLQQTTVGRVVPKYRAFLRSFPSLRVLSRAPLRDVLVAWQGLGYNRRAKYLWEAAQAVVRDHGGRLPRTRAELCALPGIGEYTAGAVAVFAWKEPVVLIETNIRTVFMHHFFDGQTAIRDAELLPLVEATLVRDDPRTWYWALMDYGAALKRQGIAINDKSAHYVRQSRFIGSSRELRGKILSQLLIKSHSAASIAATTGRRKEDVHSCLLALEREGLVRRLNRKWQLA